ncbi:MAG: hypothetical protein SPH73_07815 [Veillonella caviae]|nr:hypothetical protein [Veillonella caviae]
MATIDVITLRPAVTLASPLEQSCVEITLSYFNKSENRIVNVPITQNTSLPVKTPNI